MWAPRYETKIAILEQKLDMYEEMLEKIDNAIQKISDSNSCITRMLAIHEERLEQTIKSDKTINDNIISSKHEIEKELEKINNKVDDCETKIEELNKFKWMAAGIGALLALTITAVTSLASGWLTPPNQSVIMPGVQNQK